MEFSLAFIKILTQINRQARLFTFLLLFALCSCTSKPTVSEVPSTAVASLENSKLEKAPSSEEPALNPSPKEGPYADNISLKNSIAKESTLSPVTALQEDAPKLPPPHCDINFYPDAVPAGGGTVLTWKMENAITGSYNCRNQLVKGEVNATVGQIKIEKTPISLFCIFSAISRDGQKSNCSASLISQGAPGSGPHCTAGFYPSEIPKGGRAILSWSSVRAQRVFYSCPSLKKNAEVRENFGSRAFDKILKTLDCEITVIGDNNNQNKCRASLQVSP